jgi:TatD DNase family protein
MLVDSHCHLDRLDLTPFGGDFSTFMEEVEKSMIDRMLCVCISLSQYPAMRELVDGEARIDVSVGVHPSEHCDVEPCVDELVRLGGDQRVVAIGETGLDYYRDGYDAAVQEERFRRHIRAARRLGKPLIVHSRSAPNTTLRLLAEEDARDVGGVFHCFTEDWNTARDALDLNFFISFSGIVTFKNAAVLQDVARRVPSDRYLIETDAPYLAPVPMRGKPNYPLYLRHVAEFVAGLRGVTLNRIAAESGANYFTLFPTATSLRPGRHSSTH